MVERGIIKVYFGGRSYNKGRYGFIRVIGEDGKPTGEEVYFHLNSARQLDTVGDFAKCTRAIVFSDTRASIDQLDGEPLKGDHVFFTAEPNSPKRRVTAWTTQEAWVDFADEIFFSDLDAFEADEFAKEQERRDCPGDCGQPAYACTCIELASFRSHNSMTDGYWTA